MKGIPSDWNIPVRIDESPYLRIVISAAAVVKLSLTVIDVLSAARPHFPQSVHTVSVFPKYHTHICTPQALCPAESPLLPLYFRDNRNHTLQSSMYPDILRSLHDFDCHRYSLHSFRFRMSFYSDYASLRHTDTLSSNFLYYYTYNVTIFHFRCQTFFLLLSQYVL